jgi:SAM-dependent methyltransferase
VDPKYGERYRELYEKHWWWRARTELIVDTLDRLRPPQGWKNILDIGCGDGLFFDRLSKFGEVEGIEPCAALLNPAGPYRSRIHVCPFDENFRPGKQYSLILMLDVLEHLENPAAAMRRALDLLTQDGFFVVTVPAFMALWTNHDVLNHHLTRYKKGSFRKIADMAGLRIQQQRYFCHWTCPIKLGIGVMERVFRPRPSIPRIPVGWINDALFWVSRMEQKTLTALTMPFGSSLLIIGTRETMPASKPLQSGSYLNAST